MLVTSDFQRFQESLHPHELVIIEHLSNLFLAERRSTLIIQALELGHLTSVNQFLQVHIDAALAVLVATLFQEEKLLAVLQFVANLAAKVGQVLLLFFVTHLTLRVGSRHIHVLPEAIFLIWCEKIKELLSGIYVMPFL